MKLSPPFPVYQGTALHLHLSCPRVQNRQARGIPNLSFILVEVCGFDYCGTERSEISPALLRQGRTPFAWIPPPLRARFPRTLLLCCTTAVQALALSLRCLTNDGFPQKSGIKSEYQDTQKIVCRLLAVDAHYASKWHRGTVSSGGASVCTCAK